MTAQSLNSRKMAMSDSVKQWLVDLRDEVELECMCVLQGKSLTKESTDLVFVLPKSTKDHVHSIHQSLLLIKSDIKALSSHIEKCKWESVQSISKKINTQSQYVMSNCQSAVLDFPSHLIQLQQRLIQDCSNLAHYLDCDLKNKMPDQALIRGTVISLEQSLELFVDEILVILIQMIFDDLVQQCYCYRDGNSVNGAKIAENGQTSMNGFANINPNDIRRNNFHLLIVALSDIITIGLLSNHMCSLIAKANGVDVLLQISQNASLKFVHGEALRALATICCVSESIEQLDQAGGIQCLSDILCGSRVPERIRSEAAGVIAQISSQSLMTCKLQMSFMENLLELVRSLTGLCRDTYSHDIFLISCAALANMTLLDDMTCEYLTQCGTAAVLVDACLKNKAQSIFAKEQVVSVFETMASIGSCFKDLTSDQRMLELLVTFLNEHPRNGATAMELAAYEKLLQKTATTISQLSRHKEIALTFVKFQCIPCLVQLCKRPELRNHSDEVLMACLAALRKIFSVCGPNHEVLRDEEEAKQLVTSRIIDSFILCTAGNESFI